jgi:KDO2-lipid IV(A) lauroyltransferase
MANADPAAAAREPSSAKRVKPRHYLEAALAHAMMAVLSRVPLAAASGVGGALARTLGPLGKPWHTALRNLARAMPERAAPERAAIARAAFDNFGRTMAEYAHIPRLWQRRWDGLIQAGGEGLAAAVQPRKAAIVFTAHIGNWEIAPLILAARGKPALLVYRAPNNPLVDAMIARIRTDYAAGLAPKGADGLRQIVAHLQDGGTVYMVVDQKTNTGPEIPFFGRGARTGKAIARLAMKYGCALIPAHCERVGGARFRVSFETPWSVEGDAGNPDHVATTLRRINARIEDWVRAQPGQWMWMHKRWPD